MVNSASCNLLSVIQSIQLRSGAGAESPSGDPAIVIMATLIRLIVWVLEPISGGFNVLCYYRRLRRNGAWHTVKDDFKTNVEIFRRAPRWVQVPFLIIAVSTLFHWYHPVAIILGAVVVALLLSVVAMSTVVAVRRV